MSELSTDEIESRTGRNNAQFGHFRSFVCKGGQRNLQIIITHVDVGKSYWNSQRKAGLGTHFFRDIISVKSQQKC